MRFGMFVCCFFAMPLLAGEGWITHITPPGSFYQTELVVTNTSQVPGKAALFDQDGNLWQEAELEAGQTEVYPIGPEGPQVSHLRFETTHPWIDVAARYRGDDMINGPLVPGVVNAARLHRYHLRQSDRLWHGLALVNAGDRPTPVTLTQYSEDREHVLQRIALSSDLPPGQKLTASLSALALPGDWSVVEIAGDVPLAVTVLEGNYAGEVDGFLARVEAQQAMNDSIVATMSGGLVLTHKVVTIIDGQLAYRLDGGWPTREHFAAIPEYSALLAELEEMGIRDVSVTSGDDNCCDKFTYTLSIISGTVRNDLLFHDTDVDNRVEGAEEARAIVQRIIALAESLNPDLE